MTTPLNHNLARGFRLILEPDSHLKCKTRPISPGLLSEFIKTKRLSHFKVGIPQSGGHISMAY